MSAAPYPPLLADAATLQNPPVSAEGLRRRMAEVYGVQPENVLPVRGRWHGASLVFRYAVNAGGRAIAAPARPEFARLAQIAGVQLDPKSKIRFVSSPDAEGGVLREADAMDCARDVDLLVVDESLIEFADADSLAVGAAAASNVLVIRDLAQPYGLAGEPCAALVGAEALIKTLEALLEPDALSTPLIRTALTVLDASKTAHYKLRFAEVRAEKRRMAEALGSTDGVTAVDVPEGPFIIVGVTDLAAATRELRRSQVEGTPRDERIVLRVAAPAANDRALAALGAKIPLRRSRQAEVVRETLETRVVVSVDLDAEGTSEVATGVGFYDHMLHQVAAHGGFKMSLRCAGDLEIDTHHTIEDCALALGQALKQALGDRKGIGRFGFTLPMDEAEAKVSVDLGGRPYLVFEAGFSAPFIGEYPVEMTEHVFRSLSQSMGASIHVSVRGENDHHKTEACFKAFGRALRQAIRIESEALPSTKGIIS